MHNPVNMLNGVPGQGQNFNLKDTLLKLRHSIRTAMNTRVEELKTEILSYQDKLKNIKNIAKNRLIYIEPSFEVESSFQYFKAIKNTSVQTMTNFIEILRNVGITMEQNPEVEGTINLIISDIQNMSDQIEEFISRYQEKAEVLVDKIEALQRSFERHREAKVHVEIESLKRSFEISQRSVVSRLTDALGECCKFFRSSQGVNAELDRPSQKMQVSEDNPLLSQMGSSQEIKLVRSDEFARRLLSEQNKSLSFQEMQGSEENPLQMRFSREMAVASESNVRPRNFVRTLDAERSSETEESKKQL